MPTTVASHQLSPGMQPSGALRTYKQRLIIRTAIVLAILPLFSVMIYYRLGPFQHVFRPPTPSGGWVIDPPSILQIFLAWYGPVFVALPTINRFRKRWPAQDQKLGIVPNRTPRASLLLKLIVGWPIVLLLAGLLIFALYGFFFGYTIVSAEGIRSWTPIGLQDKTYPEVQNVIMLPDGYRRGNNAIYGPIATVHFKTGRDVQFGQQNGLTVIQIDAIAQSVANYAGMTVQTDPLAQRR